MIYLDSSAVVKLVRVEAESAALVSWLNQQAGAVLASSALVEVEVPRALRRTDPEALPAVALILSTMYKAAIDTAVRATAAAYLDPAFRSLDAVHLATAENLAAAGQSISAFVTYDQRLAAAAMSVGLRVLAPA